LEKTNIRYLDTAPLKRSFDFISIDVSFISLKLVLPVAAEIIKPGGGLICLVKPQFEAGRGQVGKKGVVRDTEIHKEVVAKVIGYGRENGLHDRGAIPSPITGAKGNIEYLLFFDKE
jgi:23S rRNA (cytidine1920-2'-O)/16S rRNA (cytidine1409-2'-O)-methyltransferase